MLAKFISMFEMRFQNTETALKNKQASIQRVENQISELVKLVSERQQDNLPSNTKTNPKEQVYAIIVQSRDILTKPEKKLNLETIEKNDGVEENKKEHKSVVKEYKPPIPYSEKVKKDPMNKQYGDLTIVELNGECSAILQNKLPTKLKDRGSFTIPYFICNLNVEKPLANLGAKPTTISIQLADRSVKYPRGIIEYVLVKIDKSIIPVDFIILDMDEDIEVPIILGQPFLATAIDVGNGELVLRVGDEKVTLQARDVVRVSSK
ncbi:Integrase, catalytic core [Gossypium australe]|uniref:Integrase, catalytic core n=1 Tax=Gossypium australe TaxID=47621 RepID=A0A5B6X2S2_9ROSI|nr:Integrase, catalytic core [Gossypium australe]